MVVVVVVLVNTTPTTTTTTTTDGDTTLVSLVLCVLCIPNCIEESLNKTDDFSPINLPLKVLYHLDREQEYLSFQIYLHGENIVYSLDLVIQ